MKRILIADDHEVFRRGLQSMLESHEGWSVCAEASDGREALEKAEETDPDLVILDLSMPRLGGLEVVRRMVKTRPKTPVLVLTMHESEQMIHEVISAGAHGYVLKSDAGRDLTEAVEAILAGRPYFTQKAGQIVLRDYRDGGATRVRSDDGIRLTPREREILQLVAEGLSTKEVAAALGIAPKTAETHRTNIMRKLSLRSVAEIVRYAVRNGIVQP